MAGVDKLEFKLILIGDFGCGKTSLTRRFTEEKFSDTPLPDSFETMGREVQVGLKTVTLKIADTAGGEKFRTLTSSFFRHADAVIIAFDLTSQESFTDIPAAHKEASYYASRALRFMVGNKADLAESRVVTAEQAQEVAKSLQLPYFETSAKTGQGVMELFNRVAKDLLAHAQETAPIEEPRQDILNKPKKSGCLLL